MSNYALEYHLRYVGCVRYQKIRKYKISEKLSETETRQVWEGDN